MEKSKGLFQLAHLSNVVIVVCCITLLVVGARSTKTHQHDDIKQQQEELKQTFRVESLKVTNLTSRFEVSRLEKTSEGNILIQLRNNYDKTITAYQTSLGSTTTLVEMILSPLGDYIHPGDTTDLMEGINIDPDLEKEGFTIHAVVFEDGTSDGETKSINKINDYRRGEMMQMAHAARLLGESAGAADGEIVWALDKVGNTSVLTGDGAGTLSRSVKFGAEDARKRISILATGAKEQGDGNIKSRMNKLLDFCGKKSEQLSLYNKASAIKGKARVQ